MRWFVVLVLLILGVAMICWGGFLGAQAGDSLAPQLIGFGMVLMGSVLVWLGGNTLLAFIRNDG